MFLDSCARVHCICLYPPPQWQFVNNPSKSTTLPLNLVDLACLWKKCVPPPKKMQSFPTQVFVGLTPYKNDHASQHRLLLFLKWEQGKEKRPRKKTARHECEKKQPSNFEKRYKMDLCLRLFSNHHALLSPSQQPWSDFHSLSYLWPP